MLDTGPPLPGGREDGQISQSSRQSLGLDLAHLLIRTMVLAGMTEPAQGETGDPKGSPAVGLPGLGCIVNQQTNPILPRAIRGGDWGHGGRHGGRGGSGGEAGEVEASMG